MACHHMRRMSPLDVSHTSNTGSIDTTPRVPQGRARGHVARRQPLLQARRIGVAHGAHQGDGVASPRAQPPRGRSSVVAWPVAHDSSVNGLSARRGHGVAPLRVEPTPRVRSAAARPPPPSPALRATPAQTPEGDDDDEARGWRRGFGYGHSSDEAEWQWCFIEPTGKDRFKHKARVSCDAMRCHAMSCDVMRPERTASSARRARTRSRSICRADNQSAFLARDHRGCHAMPTLSISPLRDAARGRWTLNRVPNGTRARARAIGRATRRTTHTQRLSAVVLTPQQKLQPESRAITCVACHGVTALGASRANQTQRNRRRPPPRERTRQGDTIVPGAGTRWKVGGVVCAVVSSVV